jgi:hypothetical protein
MPPEMLHFIFERFSLNLNIGWEAIVLSLVLLLIMAAFTYVEMRQVPAPSVLLMWGIATGLGALLLPGQMTVVLWVSGLTISSWIMARFTRPRTGLEHPLPSDAGRNRPPDVL